jgi:hypothetical protein
MTRLLVMMIFASVFAGSPAAAQQVFNGIWVVNAERLSCIAACGDRYTLSPGRNAAGQQYAVCAARVAGDKSGLRPGYNARGKPNTCMIQDGDGYIAAEDFSCYCVLVPPPDQE